MRLHSLTVRNYRVHKDCSVTFDPARNLIGGLNESGKSTLAEAAHRALFLRAKTGGSLQKEMMSSRHLGEPEVTLVFEAAGTRWELEKRFAGSSKGSTRLNGAAGSFKDDEAEAKLAELLKRGSAASKVTAGQLPSLWAHLWVWQGSSGEDPSGHASDHKDSLVQRLQQDGIAAVMQSDADQRVRQRIASAYGELYTPATGKLKAGAPPEQARLAMIEAVENLQGARDAYGRLEAAVADYARAEHQVAEANAVLPGFRAQKAEVEKKLAQVKDLRVQEESRRRIAQAATAARGQLAQHHEAIGGFHDQAAKLRLELLPAEEKETGLQTAEAEASASAGSATAAHRQMADAVRLARQHCDLAAAIALSLEKSDARRILAERSEEAERILAEIKRLRIELSKLPPVSSKELEALRKLERDASQAAIALEAMATGVELLQADRSVVLDGETLSAGDSRVLTDSGELLIGDGTRLRIRPGGGTSLSDARSRAESAKRQLVEGLDRHSLTDLAHAAGVFEQRQSLDQQLAHLDTRWQALGGEKLGTALNSAITASDAAAADVQRRREAIADGVAWTMPASSGEAASRQAELQGTLRLAEEAETEARGKEEQLRNRLAKAGEALQSHRASLVASRQVLRDLETRIGVLEDAHGAAAARDAKLKLLREEEAVATADLDATLRSLEALAPDTLAADLERFDRSIAQQEGRLREGENIQLVARSQLSLDGSVDPLADLSHAAAKLDHAREVHLSAERRAKAIEKLHGLFSESREAIDRSLVQPLADRITGYLQCLYGPGAEVRVKLAEGGIEGFELVRGDDQTFGFDTLSGGAREQVAAAVRLALAEILAADHDGCLPVVFDDAFAYTDPERVQALQRMLDLAARRGLQVILLTCTPADYLALGATEIRLG